MGKEGQGRSSAALKRHLPRGGRGGRDSAPQGAQSGRRRSVEIQSKEGLEEMCVCLCVSSKVCIPGIRFEKPA